MADDKKKLDGHRRAIREHIEKYGRYTADQDKKFALKTIERVQGEIRDLKRRNQRLDDASEDAWKPPR